MEALYIYCLAWIYLVTLLVRPIESCSCQPTHPQQHYCNSDFVILARVKREHVSNGTVEYKIRIRKEYKMSEKAEVALKGGRLVTASEESVCGLRLQVGKVYAISGKVVSLQARVNMCGLADRWEELSRRQRKGLKMMYRQGCTCGIKFCAPHRRCTRTSEACNWDSWHPMKKRDCQRNEGICLRTASNQCLWSKSSSLALCTRNSIISKYEPKLKLPQRYNNLPFLDDRGKKFGQ